MATRTIGSYGTFAAAATMVLLGCGDGDDSGSADAMAGGADALALSDSAPGTDASSEDPGGPQFEDAVGSIDVLEWSWPGGANRYGGLAAHLYDHAPKYYTEVMREGSCRLLRYQPGFCDPACSFNEYCGTGNQCEPRPVPQTAGVITFTGLTTEASLTPSGGGGYYSQSPSTLPVDLFGPSSIIVATAPGDSVAGFTLSVQGVAPSALLLAGELQDELQLVDGQELVVTWTDPDPNARVSLWLPTPNQGHGMPSSAVIECNARDTGSLVIARALVEAYPEQARHIVCVGNDCPPGVFTRYRRSEVTTADGVVALRASVQELFYVVHAVAN